MATEIDYPGLFAALKELLAKYGKHLVVGNDSDNRYDLNSTLVGPNKLPHAFASVMVFKGHVGFYFMPIYANPALREDLSDGLRKCLKGKSCFHFKKHDAKLFGELAKLVQIGFEEYKARGLIP